jgi:hypothetical protein
MNTNQELNHRVTEGARTTDFPNPTDFVGEYFPYPRNPRNLWFFFYLRPGVLLPHQIFARSSAGRHIAWLVLTPKAW